MSQEQSKQIRLDIQDMFNEYSNDDLNQAHLEAEFSSINTIDEN